MKWVKKGLLLVVGLWLLCMAFQQAAWVRFLLPTVSVRFDAALTAEQVARAREYAAQTDSPYLTFWAERTAYAENGIKKRRHSRLPLTEKATLRIRRNIPSAERHQSWRPKPAPSVPVLHGRSGAARMLWG